MSKKHAVLEDLEKIPRYGTTPNDAGQRKPSNQNEDLLRATIGNFGRWQFKIALLMALLKFPIAWFSLSIVFLAPPTQFWFKPSKKYSNLTDNQWVQAVAPHDNFSLKQEGLNSGYCAMIDVENNPKNTIPCLEGYSYNKSIFRSSIISEWDLVCGHQSLIDFTQISLMLGVLIGNMLFGILADRRGRKAILTLCICLQSFFGIVASWMPWYWGFILARFLLAISNGGTIVTSFVICMEVVGGKWRTIVPILYQIPFGFGNSIMAGLAYVFRDWREFHFSISMLASVYSVYIWCIPESPRWLLVVGRREEAMVILKQAAICNKMDPAKVEAAMTELSNAPPAEPNKSSFAALFRTRQLRKRSSLLSVIWTMCGISFYGFSQYLGHVSSNLFFTVAVGGLIALPGTFLCVLLVSRCGRRWTIAVAHVMTGLCFLAILSIPKGVYHQDWPRIVFAALGIIGISVSMPAMYLFTGELFPTVLRNAGVGASVMFSRIGTMIAPMVVSLEGMGPYLPLVILATCSFIEALLVLPLPETKGESLPETIDDLETSYQKPMVERNGSYVSVPKESISVGD